MLDINKIYNVDCLKGLTYLEDNSIDIVLTSPPYNTSKTRRIWQNTQKTHYDIPSVDNMKDPDYINWLTTIFSLCSIKLKNDGVILLNLSYSTQKPCLMYEVIFNIIKNTDLTLVDTIVWKKSNALPNNMTSNRLTRICEFVFVLCKKQNVKTFKANKKLTSIDKKGVKKYTSIKNIIEAKNNDGRNKLNKATFSIDFVKQLLSMYAYDKDNVILDPFMSTGTTACGCVEYGVNYIGFELSELQCNYARERLNKYNGKLFQQSN